MRRFSSAKINECANLLFDGRVRIMEGAILADNRRLSEGIQVEAVSIPQKMQEAIGENRDANPLQNAIGDAFQNHGAHHNMGRGNILVENALYGTDHFLCRLADDN